MYGFRRPRSPSDPRTGWQDAMAGERSATAQWNPTKRRQVEQDPSTGAEPAAVQGVPCPDPTLAPEPPQGWRIPSTHTFVVILEPGTDLHLRLGDEGLVLAPQTALQLALGGVTVLIVPEPLLRRAEDLLPAHARWLLPLGADTAWKINIEDGSLSARQARASSPPSPSTLLLKPLYRPAAPQGCSGLPRPRPGRRSLPAQFSLDLGGLGPSPGPALRPLPTSPSPGTRTCSAVRRRPPSKVQRRLF